MLLTGGVQRLSPAVDTLQRAKLDNRSAVTYGRTQLSTKREIADQGNAPRSSPLSDLLGPGGQRTIEISDDSDPDEPKSAEAQISMRRTRSRARSATPPGQIDSDKEDGGSAVFTDGEDDEDGGAGDLSDVSMGSESSWEGEGSEAEDDEGTAIIPVMDPSGTDDTSSFIDPTLRAASAKMDYLQRRLVKLEKAAKGHAMTKRRAHRVTSQLQIELFISSAYRRATYAAQLELKALQEKVAQRAAGETDDEMRQLRSAKEAAEAKLQEAEEKLRFIKEVQDVQRASLRASKQEAEKKKNEAVKKAKTAILAQQAAEKRSGVLEEQEAAARAEILGLQATVEQAEKAKGYAERRVVTARTAQETERLSHETQLAVAEAARRAAVASKDKAIAAKEGADAWLAQSKAMAESFRQQADTAMAKNERLSREIHELEQRMQATTTTWANDRAVLQMSIEELKGKAAELEVKRLEAQTEKEQAERKLDVMKEAHDMEREMYVERIRDLTGRGKAQQGGGGEEVQ